MHVTTAGVYVPHACMHARTYGCNGCGLTLYATWICTYLCHTLTVFEQCSNSPYKSVCACVCVCVCVFVWHVVLMTDIWDAREHRSTYHWIICLFFRTASFPLPWSRSSAGRLSYGFLWVSCCSNTLFQNFNGISPEFRQNIELEHIRRGDNRNSVLIINRIITIINDIISFVLLLLFWSLLAFPHAGRLQKRWARDLLCYCIYTLLCLSREGMRRGRGGVSSGQSNFELGKTSFEFVEFKFRIRRGQVSNPENNVSNSSQVSNSDPSFQFDVSSISIL